VEDLRRYYIAYVNAYQQTPKYPETKEFLSSAPQKILTRIDEIRFLEQDIERSDDTISVSLYEYLDSLSSTINPPDRERWEHYTKNLSLLLERALISAQKRTGTLISDSSEITATATLNGVLISILMLALSAGSAILVAKKISRPIAHLRQATHYARMGKYNIRVPFETRDEIADLTADFNAMLDALGKLEKMKAMFLSSITHDLKSPLYRVKLGIENIQDGIHGTIKSEQKKALDQILADLDTLSRLIYDILDLQKLESGKFDLHLEEVRLDDFVRQIVKKHAISFSDKGVGLAIRMKIPDVIIRIDKKQIERVFENLLSNALKFTPSGGKVTVIATNEKDKIHFAVIDNGPGMSATEVQRIFDKFFRAQTGKDVKGTGLGLAIAKQIVVAHSGRIWAESIPGEGTEFHFVCHIENE